MRPQGLQGGVRVHSGKGGIFRGQAGEFGDIGGRSAAQRQVTEHQRQARLRLDYPALAVYSSYAYCVIRVSSFLVS